MVKKSEQTNATYSPKSIRNIFLENPIFYKHLIELAPEAIIIHSEGKFVYVNPAAQKLIGAQTQHEIIGKKIMDFVHPDSTVLIRERIERMLSNKKVEPFAVEKFITMKGETILADTKAVPFTFQGKTSILVILHNITKRKKEQQQQYFLNNISKVLSSSIDYKTTLRNVIRSIVPALSDYTRLILIDDNKNISEEVSYHVDQQKLEDVKELYKTQKDGSESIFGVGSILSDGKSEIVKKISPSVLARYKANRQLMKVIKTFGLTSHMGVPLMVQNKVIGALTFSSNRKGRTYTKDDLRFAEEVARRIAFAIENARLFNQAQKTNEIEERLAAIVASSDDAIVSKTLDGVGIINSWNKSAEKMFGYSAEEAIGKPSSFIIPENLWAEEKKIILKIKKGKHIDKYETLRLRKDGRKIFVSLTVSAIKDSDGKIIGVSKIARDITDKKKTENELMHLASLVEASSDAIWSSTLDHKVLTWNKGAEKLYGFRAKEVIGTNIIGAVVPDDKLEEHKKTSEKVIRGEQVEALETARLTKEGRRLDVSMTLASIKDAQKNIIGISAIVRDISAQKEQEKLKDEFISMASHELKTPITSMKMFLDILSSYLGEQNVDAQKYVKRIKDQTNKMKDLVNDLLDVSRIGMGKLRFNSEKFRLDEAIQDTVESIQPAAKKHALIFSVREDLIVYGDKFRIYQVITNLVNNAIKYSPEGKKIIIKVKAIKGEAIVSVQDFGIGIAKEKQQKIFEKLYQVTDPEEKTYPGLGMGLYISKEIINGHNGRMWVKSKKGTGSTFYFSLQINTD